MFIFNNKNTRTLFAPFSSVSIANFEHPNICWEMLIIATNKITQYVPHKMVVMDVMRKMVVTISKKKKVVTEDAMKIYLRLFSEKGHSKKLTKVKFSSKSFASKVWNTIFTHF